MKIGINRFTKESISKVFGDNVSVNISIDNNRIPVIITPISNKNSLDKLNINSKDLDEIIAAFGAILLRGFEIGSPEKFNSIFSALFGDTLPYKDPTSPREKIFENIYTSTIYPRDQRINMHTEKSYSMDYNRIIAFCCMVPPESEGETPIADERNLLNSLDSEIIDEFRRRGIQYVRNFVTGVGLDWKTAYQTSNKTEVNEMFRSKGIKYEWISEDHLRLKWTLPALQIHPVTKQEVWFNHMYFYHRSMYPSELLEYFGDDELPFVTYFGDGGIIEDWVIEKIRKFYSESSIIFKWKKNDFLLLDNMLFSHGRNKYASDRLILTAMAKPQSFHGNKIAF